MSRLASPRAYSQLCRAPNRDPCKKNHAVFPTKDTPPLLFSRSPDSVNNPTPYLRERIPPPGLFLTPPRAISSDTPFTHQCTLERVTAPGPESLNILRFAQPSASACRRRSRADLGIRPIRIAHCSAVSQPGGGSWPSACASTKRRAQSVGFKLDRRDEFVADLANLVKRVFAVIV